MLLQQLQENRLQLQVSPLAGGGGGAWYVSLARAGLFSLHSTNNCVQSLFYVVWIATICRLCGSVNLPHFVCFIHLPHLQLTKEELEYRAESTDFNYTRLVQDDL